MRCQRQPKKLIRLLALRNIWQSHCGSCSWKTIGTRDTCCRVCSPISVITFCVQKFLTTDNVRRAVDIIGSGEIDVLVCDIGLPDGSGYDIILRAQEKRPIKAVALTGFGTEDDLRRSKEAGFEFHLVKPVDLHELQTILDKLAAQLFRVPLIFFAARERACDEIRVLEINSRKLTNDL